jgi:hypothetical protein
MSLAKHAAFLVAFLVLSGHAQAQFKGVAEPMPAVTAAPMAMPAPVMAPNLGTAPLPITSAPSVAPGAPVVAPAAAPEAAGAIPATAPTAMILGCPDGPDCPPEPEGLGDADKEVLKEFAKCAAEGKSLDTCLSNDPPPALSQLSGEDRAQLMQCLGSSDLSSTKERWSGCLVGAD